MSHGLLDITSDKRLEKTPSSRLSYRLLTAFLCLAFVVGCLILYFFGYYFSGKYGFSVGNDDSFITYIYSRNLVDYGVVSFNKQDEVFVEGFSNPLHMLLSAGIYVLTGPNWLYPVNAVLGAIAVLAAMLCISFSRSFPALNEVGSSRVCMLAAMCASPSLWVHATSGLETAWVFLGQVIFWLLVVQDRQTSRTVLGLVGITVLLTLLRTDGFVFPLIGALWLALSGNVRCAIAIILAASLAFFSAMVLRVNYYGELMPNTYYAKVNGELLDRVVVAARYLGSIAIKNGFLLAFLACLASAIAFVVNKFPGRNRTPSFELSAFCGLVVYYLYIGGDIYRERFLLILLPLGLVLALRLLADLHLARFFPFAAIAVVAHQLAAIAVDPRLDLAFDNPKYDRFIALGTHLGEAHPDALLATGAAGKIPYFSGLETIDMLGLNDLHIARVPALNANPGHGRFDTEYVLSRGPDLICDHVYGDGHMVYGLDREVYSAHGYDLAYLARHREIDGPDIKAVQGQPKAMIEASIASGYQFGCLLKS
jgi:hypothetical protein